MAQTSWGIAKYETFKASASLIPTRQGRPHWKQTLSQLDPQTSQKNLFFSHIIFFVNNRRRKEIEKMWHVQVTYDM